MIKYLSIGFLLILSGGIVQGQITLEQLTRNSPYTLKYRESASDSGINKALSVIDAGFYQIKDSLSGLISDIRNYETIKNSKDPSHLYYDDLKDSFTVKNNIQISYSIKPIDISVEDLKGTSMSFTEKMLRSLYHTELPSVEGLSEAQIRLKADSAYLQLADFIKKKMALITSPTRCLTENEVVLPNKNYKTALLNADSVLVLQSVIYYNPKAINEAKNDISPYCWRFLTKYVIGYKKNVGYFKLGYNFSNAQSNVPNMDFNTASKLLDKAIQQTWGIIRFDK